jgi:hypothetical protein
MPASTATDAAMRIAAADVDDRGGGESAEHGAGEGRLALGVAADRRGEIVRCA